MRLRCCAERRGRCGLLSWAVSTLAQSLSLLGWGISILKRQGRFKEAETLLRRALEVTRATEGSLHPNTFSCLCNLGALLNDQGRLREAEPLLREMVEGSRTVLGAQHSI